MGNVASEKLDQFRNNPLFPLLDALALLGSTPVSTARDWIREGKLQTVKLGGRHYVSLQEISRLRGEH